MSARSAFLIGTLLAAAVGTRPAAQECEYEHTCPGNPVDESTAAAG